MKKLLFVIMLFTATQGFAQNKVSGRVADKLSGSPEPGAVAQVLDGDRTLGYAVTDSLGLFGISLRANEGSYILEVKNLGRKTVRKEFSWNGQDLDLGTVAIEDDVETLKSATVTTQRTLVKMDVDKTTYDVAGDTDARASTVLDMLRKVPMVTVDGQDNITVNGSGTFKVYVDGKPNQMLSSNPSKIFKAMPASAVQSIEVITNPGAKYDAEGAGSVLNLITRSADGTKAGLPDGASGQTSIAADTRGGYNGGLVLNAKKGKFTFGSNIFAGHQYHKDIQVDYNHTSGAFEQNTSAVADQKVPMLFGDLNASLELDTLNLVSASLGIQSWHSRQKLSASLETSNGGAPLYSYDSEGENTYGSDGINASVDWQHNFRGHSDRSLTFSYRFNGDPEVSGSRTEYSNITGGIPMADSRSDCNDRSLEHTFQGDYTTPLAKGQELSTGVKYIFRHNTADDRFYNWDGAAWTQTNTDGNYDHYNNIAAAYAEWSGNFGKVGFKAGLRYEHTFQTVDYSNGTSFRSEFGNPVPSASIQYNLSPASNVGLSYNMQIQRPGISYLNPYVDRSNPLMISYGNSDIVPARTHRLTLKYNFFSPKVMVSASAGWNHCNDGMAQYTKFVADTMHTTYGNILLNDAVRLNGFINWNIGNKTRVYTNLDGNWQSFSSKKLDQSNSGFGFSGLLGMQQTFPWDLRLSANLFCNTRRYNLQGWNGGFSGIALSLSKSVLDDKLSFSLRGFTPLTGIKAEFSNFTKGNGFRSEQTVRLPIGSVGLEISYSFGKNSFQVKKARKTISNDDLVNSDSRQGQVNTSQAQQQ